MRSPHSIFGIFLALASSLALGCASYQIGARTLYRPDVETIYVPIFRSASFRRGLDARLTEAVIKEIQLKTPYRVVCEADADSRLTGNIVYESKAILAEDNFDVPRNIRTNLTARVRWESRGGDLLQQADTRLPPILQINQEADLIPEAGQSIATAHQRAIEQLAEQIVAQMEYPW